MEQYHSHGAKIQYDHNESKKMMNLPNIIWNIFVIPLFPPTCKYNYVISKRLWTYMSCVDFGKWWTFSNEINVKIFVPKWKWNCWIIVEGVANIDYAAMRGNGEENQ
jgi:hypothetical protein